jgi:integrase
VLTPEQCKAALAWARTRPLLPWLVLGLLCGLRPEEADQTTAAHVDLKAGWLTVDAQSSKVRQRRIVHLTPQAREWLKRCRKQDFTMTRQRRRRWMRSLRDELKLPRWPQDVLRHTFASFTMAEVQDAGKVAAEMGNSAGVLMRHYRELMTRDDAKRYRKAMAVPTSSPSRIPRGKPD